MKNFRSLILLSGLIVLLFNCSNSSEDDLIIPEPNPTYTNKIANIMSTNCTNCHGATPTNGASMPLDTYDNVKLAVEFVNLICRINGSDCGSQMPLGAQLPQNVIDQIEKWQTDNFPEN